ncbi:MAG: SIS domain-containing protein [Syntrophomonadaceae bacterium]|nr:SIS domain-containing protein [Syntrophomonadaceae bacterium]
MLTRYPVLELIADKIGEAYSILETGYASGGKLLIAGNGGSAADAEHIVGELMKGFKKKRNVSAEFAARLSAQNKEIGARLSDGLQGALPAIALHNHPSLSTAFLNDVDGLLCFAQQVYGYGTKDDVLLCISTSGNALNVLHAAVTAKAIGMKVISLTGATGGKLKDLSDVTVNAPETETYMIQELHLPIYHCWCTMLEDEFFLDEK